MKYEAMIAKREMNEEDRRDVEKVEELMRRHDQSPEEIEKCVLDVTDDYERQLHIKDLLRRCHYEVARNAERQRIRDLAPDKPV